MVKNFPDCGLCFGLKNAAGYTAAGYALGYTAAGYALGYTAAGYTTAGYALV